MDLKKQAISGAKWTTVSIIITTLLHAIQLAVLARILSPEVFGLLAILMIVIGFSQSFMDMGLGNIIIHKQEMTQSQLSSLYWLNLSSGLFLTTVVFFLAPIIANFYNDIGILQPLRTISFVFLILSIGSQFKSIFQKNLEFKLMANIDIAAAIISFATALWLALLDYKIYALIYAFVVQSTISSLAYFFFGIKKYNKPNLHFNYNELKGFYSFGLYQMGEKSVNYLSANIDKLIIGKLIGMQALGFYNLASQIIVLPLTKINPIINKIAFPVYAKIQNDTETTNRYYQIAIKGISLMTIPFLAFMCFFSEELVLVVFGLGWDTTADLIPLLTFAALFKVISNPGGSVLLAKGFANVGFWWNVFWAIILTLSLYTFLSIKPEIMSAPLALITITLMFGWIWHYAIAKIAKIKYNKIILDCLKIVFISFSVAGLADLILENFQIENTLLKIFLAACICSFMYLPYLYFFQKDMLKHILVGAK